ncbi:MAG: response regulator transcription factor [Gemmatimonadota bacterium]|nr:response regulator transcription factor [Gemmatimonadota bacterium]
MQKIMLMASKAEQDVSERVFRDLATLEYEVLRPGSDDGWEDLEKLAQVDIFVLILTLIPAGREPGSIEPVAKSLSNDEALSDIPRLIITDEKTLERLDYCRLADDILLLPYSVAELAARIRMILWRNHKIESSQQIRGGELTINLSTYEVTVGGRLIDLTFKEYELLRYLVSHQGRVYTRRDLLNRVWGEDYYGGSRTVDVHVRRIRSKIETIGKVYIQTVRGVGYKFVC